MKYSRQEIEKILDRDIRPVLSEHQGNISLVDCSKDSVIKVSFSGACRFCPTAQNTIEEIVQTTLRTKLNDENLQVILISEVSKELLSMARKILKKKG